MQLVIKHFNDFKRSILVKFSFCQLAKPLRMPIKYGNYVI